MLTMGPSHGKKSLAIWALLLATCQQQSHAMTPLYEDRELIMQQQHTDWSEAVDAGEKAPIGLAGGALPAELSPIPASESGVELVRKLTRRQVSYPNVQNEPPKPGVFSSLFQTSDPQVDRFKAVQSLFSSATSQPQQAASAFQPAQLMAQLSELIKATQDRQAKALETTERAVQGAQQQGALAAKQAQGGIQLALAEMGQGLQRLAANNPNLLPDIKNLYQSISSKLTGASSSVAQAVAPPKNGVEQFAEQLAKAGQSGS